MPLKERLVQMGNLILLTTSFPGEHPGSEAAGSYVADLAAALAEYHDITVLAPSRNSGVERLSSTLTVSRFPVPFLPLSLLRPYDPFHWPSIVRTMQFGLRALEDLCGRKKVDHILALWVLPSGWWAREIRKKFGVPYSVWALGSDIWTLSRIPVVRKILDRTIRDSCHCFADGLVLKDDVERISGRPCEFLASVRNLPVNGTKSISKGPSYRLAFLGRWHRNKGIDLLLESLGKLGGPAWARIEEVKICGGGPLEVQIRSGCEALKKAGHPVTLGGYLDKLEAARLLEWADYLVIPSRIESIPVVFSDAMQAKCPVIATPVGDIPRLLSQYKVGTLARELSAQALCDAITEALDSPPKVYEKGLGLARADFDVRRVARYLAGLLANSPGGKKPREERASS
jgi:glycosyltransferase involved in cell wall biosynthesis